MTTEEIQKLVEDLLAPTVETLIKDVRSYITESNDTLDKRLQALETPKTTEDKSQDPAESALDARVKSLEAQLTQAEELRLAQEKQAAALRFDNNLSAVLDELKPLHKATVQELLANRIKQDAVEKEGSWLTKDGKKLSEAVQEFFSTDTGKHFLPSSHKDGAGSTEANPDRSQQQLSTTEALRQAFL